MFRNKLITQCDEILHLWYTRGEMPCRHEPPDRQSTRGAAAILRLSNITSCRSLARLEHHHRDAAAPRFFATPSDSTRRLKLVIPSTRARTTGGFCNEPPPCC